MIELPIWKDSPETPITAEQLNAYTEAINELNETLSKLPTPADYVIEQGTSGIWTYQKWNSGLYECWCQVEGQTSSSTPSSTFGYFHSETVSYPIEFKKAPTVHIELKSESGFAISVLSVNNSVLDRVQFYFDFTDSTSKHITMISAIGYWKEV